MTQLKEDLRKYGLLIIALLFYILITNIIFHTCCPFKIIFKRECPGCGLTRATIALLSGNIKESFAYNYTCPLWLITAIFFIIDRYIHKFKKNYGLVLLIITSLVTIIRYVLNFFL